jgi:tetraacyldisaccharide 4'-kinase
MAGAALQQNLLRAWQGRGLLACALWPLAQIYRATWSLRTFLYRIGMLPAHKLPVPVIVVGNVIAGGGGKTPLVMELVQRLQALGLHPGIVSRGYGRTRSDNLAVTTDSDPADVGDEPLLIHRRTGAPVQVATRRVDAAQALLSAHPQVDLLVCDDGLQHRALHRDIEICVFDERVTGNGWLLPAGPLREPWPRATDLVVCSGPLTSDSAHAIERVLADHAVRADGTTVALDTLMADADGRPVSAVAGIARPQAFFAMLRARGLVLDQTLALPDHASMDGLARTVPAQHLLLCTEKDAVKLWRQRPDALAVPLVVSLQPDFWRELLQLLHLRGPAAWGAKLSSTNGHTPT